VIHKLQNKANVHQVGDKNKFIFFHKQADVLTLRLSKDVVGFHDKYSENFIFSVT
jgi:hypothetical protein